MKRTIVTIDEEKCTGCGHCVTACAEGALQIVNGKARLVQEQFCDGFGDCIRECPTGALKIVEREAKAYEADTTRRHLKQTQGPEAMRRMNEAAVPSPHRHGGPAPSSYPAVPTGDCPGTRMRFMPRAVAVPSAVPATPAGNSHVPASDLEQWPVQLHLVAPGAPFFANRELAVLSTCAPVASADIHRRFIRGRGVTVGCPKLDDTAPYAEKLGAILSDPTIPKVIVVRMEVPCCSGLTRIVEEAMTRSGRQDLRGEEVTIGINGDVLGSRPIGPLA